MGTSKNGIDLARVTSKEYLAAMQAALDIVDKIKKYWADLNNKTYTTYHRIVTITDGSSNPGPGPGPGPGPECPDGFTKNANGDCVPKSAYDAPETPVVIPPSGYAAPTGTVKGSTDKSGTDSTTNDPSKDINYGLNTGGSTAALHLQDLERLANTVMVANVTKNAGQTAGQHLNDLINMSDRASAFSKEIIASNINKMGNCLWTLI